jgi:hypothetical protein
MCGAAMDLESAIESARQSAISFESSGSKKMAEEMRSLATSVRLAMTIAGLPVNARSQTEESLKDIQAQLESSTKVLPAGCLRP